MKEVIQAQRA